MATTPIPKELTEDVKAFVAELDSKTEGLQSVGQDRFGYGAWSYSKWKVLDKCPLNFYLQYVLKIKAPASILALNDTSAANIGSAAHRILEFTVKGTAIKDAYALAKAEYVQEGKLTEQMWDDSIKTVEYNISNFTDRILAFNDRHKVQQVKTEIRLAVTKDWRPTTFFANDAYFRGVIDYFAYLPNKDALIVDWKYGPPASMGIKNFRGQLDTYKPLINYAYATLNGATVGVGFIRDGEILLDRYTEREAIVNKLKNNLEWDLDGSIQRVKELGFFKHKRGPHCKYCAFDVMCKAGELKSSSLKTKKFFEIKKVD